MIRTKEDLRAYIAADRAAQPPAKSFIKRHFDDVAKMKTLLRKSEYHHNNPGVMHKLMYCFHWWRCKRIQRSYCSELWPNVFGKGLMIWHPERIIVNGAARVGDYCSLSSGVVIAHSNHENPVIGDYVELMIDSKVLGGVHVADHVRIGANALVLKDIDEANTTWAGQPAHRIGDTGTVEHPIPTIAKMGDQA